MIKVILEGQTLQMPDEVAQTDEGLIRALAPLYPDVANAEISRSVPLRRVPVGAGESAAATVRRRHGHHGCQTAGAQGCRRSAAARGSGAGRCRAARSTG